MSKTYKAVISAKPGYANRANDVRIETITMVFTIDENHRNYVSPWQSGPPVTPEAVVQESVHELGLAPFVTWEVRSAVKTAVGLPPDEDEEAWVWQ